MSCNCASSEQIKELYRRYGERAKLRKEDGFKPNFKKVAYHVGAYAVLIVLFPFLLLYVLYKGLFSPDKKISLRKFFRLDKKKEVENVGQQQNI